MIHVRGDIKRKEMINMGFKDYRNFAKRNEEVKPQETVEITEQNDDVQNEIVNDEITNIEPIQNEITEPEVEKEEKVEDKFVKGIVTAGKLNVRREANKNADVLTIVSKGTGLEINVTKSTEDFYCVKVIVNAELTTGFVMKKFVNVK